jgi:predicted PurR-regulated permease PerM
LFCHHQYFRDISILSGCFLTGLQPQPQQAVGSAANNYSTNLTSLTSSLSSLGVSAGTFLLLLLLLLHAHTPPLKHAAASVVL